MKFNQILLFVFLFLTATTLAYPVASDTAFCERTANSNHNIIDDGINDDGVVLKNLLSTIDHTLLRLKAAREASKPTDHKQFPGDNDAELNDLLHTVSNTITRLTLAHSSTAKVALVDRDLDHNGNPIHDFVDVLNDAFARLNTAREPAKAVNETGGTSIHDTINTIDNAITRLILTHSSTADIDEDRDKRLAYEWWDVTNVFTTNEQEEDYDTVIADLIHIIESGMTRLQEIRGTGARDDEIVLKALM
jgi:hypothetical protein